MKFLTWNTARRSGTISASIDLFEPDVAFYQEAKLPAEYVQPGYHSLGKNIEERGRSEFWGNLILSKTPLNEVSLNTEYQGSMIAATTVLESGIKLGLVNLYGLLESTPTKPNLKIVHFGVHRMLSDAGFWLAQFDGPKVDAFVVAGDLNKDRQMDGGKSLKSGRSIASNLLNRFSDFGLTEIIPNFYEHGVRTFKHSTSTVDWQIDHVFMSEKLTPAINSCSVVDNQTTEKLSDHFPIVLEINA